MLKGCSEACSVQTIRAVKAEKIQGRFGTDTRLPFRCSATAHVSVGCLIGPLASIGILLVAGAKPMLIQEEHCECQFRFAPTIDVTTVLAQEPGVGMQPLLVVESEWTRSLQHRQLFVSTEM
jgi:hypothetical protein